MANFAQLDENNLVIQIIVISDDICGDYPFPDSEPLGQAYCQEIFGPETTWKQTSYNGSFRYNYAGVGFLYEDDADAFIPPKTFPSWLLDTNTYTWVAPIPYPSEGGSYYWDEEEQNWV
jgi:hypothetical protein